MPSRYIDPAKLPAAVRGAIYNFLQENNRDDSDINTMTPFEALEAWLTWEGIVGYTKQITEVVDATRAAGNEGVRQFVSPSLDQIMHSSVDIAQPAYGVDLQIDWKAKTIWVNVDGVLALRVCRAPRINYSPIGE